MSEPQANPISFYEFNKPCYEFTNFAKSPFAISQIPQNLDLSPHLIGTWKTSEHLFQASKFTSQNIIEEIRRAPDTGFKRENGVFWLANSNNGKHKNEIRHDWHEVKVKVMYWVVKEKFIQNPHLKKILVETGNAELIEDSGKNDKFWGNGEKGNGIDYPFDETKGKNNLGKILMKIREELRVSPNNPPTPPPPPPFPDDRVPPQNPPDQPTPPSPTNKKEEIREKIIANNDLIQLENCFCQVASLPCYQDKEELVKKLIDVLEQKVRKITSLAELEVVIKDCKQKQFYTQNSEIKRSLDQVCAARQVELEKSAFSPKNVKNNFGNPIGWVLFAVLFVSGILVIYLRLKKGKKRIKSK